MKEPGATISSVAYAVSALCIYLIAPSYESAIFALAMIFLSIGSALYHATGDEWAQLMDEVGMYVAFSSIILVSITVPGLALYWLIAICLLSFLFGKARTYYWRGKPISIPGLNSHIVLPILVIGGLFLVMPTGYVPWMIISYILLLGIRRLGEHALGEKDLFLHGFLHGVWHIVTATLMAITALYAIS